MPPRLRLRPPLPLSRSQVAATAPRTASRPPPPPGCFFCSFPFAPPRPRPAGLSGEGRRASFRWRGALSTAAAPDVVATPVVVTPAQARANLVAALGELQKHAGLLTNRPRLQLAMRGLQQQPGHEAIRVAVLGLAGGGGSGSGSAGQTAKELLRLILADPLKDEEPWEGRLAAHDASQPLIVRVRGRGRGRGREGGGGAESSHAQAGSLGVGESGGEPVKLAMDGDPSELVVSSATLNGHNMEFLVMESSLAIPTGAPRGFAGEGETETFEETVLVPTVDIPISQDGRRYTSVAMATPVHQALIVTDGILGAAAVATMPLAENKDKDKAEILAAVDLRNANPDPGDNNNNNNMAGCSFVAYDAQASARAIALFRESVSNAVAYEALWRQSGLSAVAGWIRADTANRTDGSTKPPVRRLVASVLRSALANIQDAEAKQVSGGGQFGQKRAGAGSFSGLDTALAGWAEKSHAELQQQLDLAFASHRWRQLGWWKLFWRADDVTMLASSLIAQRFLPAAEPEIVYLAGRIEEAARLSLSLSLSQPPRPARPARPARPTGGDDDDQASPLVLYAAPAVLSSSTADTPRDAPRRQTKWPTHISFTRRYLLDETVPALQALAQKLVLQTATTSAMTAALAVLTYLSSLGAYEAGAVAALGLVWSLGRMQRRWETARAFWESEVREEGRKAVRSVQAGAADTLDGTRAVATAETDRGRVLHDLRQARELVRRAEEALQQLK